MFIKRVLEGKWGVYDVDDCVSGAQHLVDAGLVDPRRIVIRGGSAGGFTVLSAITRSTVFTAASIAVSPALSSKASSPWG